jgi:predicted RecB family nuclease
VAEYLRGDEIPACVHRVALDRGAPFDFVAPPETPEMGRRRRGAIEHRVATLEVLRATHPDAATPTSVAETRSAMREGAELVFEPRLARDDEGRRRATVQALVRVGRVDERFTYAPVLIKNHEVIEVATTRRVLEGTLERLRPTEATYLDGVGPRSSVSMTRSGLALAHATRVLAAQGHGDDHGRGAVIDRQRRLWWFELAGEGHPRFNLLTYDRLYDERRSVLDAHDAWARGEAPFPTAPYWHRDCPDCPYASYCEEQLEARDDVSLVRFTSFDQQLLLREHGVATRAQLARLDPNRARRARHRALNPLEPHDAEDVLGRGIDKLDDLIYRARAHERGTSLRILEVAGIGCPTADVEVDVDMESYEDTTYLWGASVSVNAPIEGVESGYRAFAEWGELNSASEAAIFREFWTWLDDVRTTCAREGLSFAAYCFWAHAEDGAMNRAVDPPLAGGPTSDELEAFRRSTPAQWIDLHELAKRQLQTEGPLGLKQLAMAAGFRWRDANPSGEASILWYEEATGPDPEVALAARTRLMQYNEDDCRATKALRDWLNGAARTLAHRDDPL